MKKNKETKPGNVGTTGNSANPKKPFESQEKSSLGGDYNSGVTSGDANEKDQIEKQATLGKSQPRSAERKKEEMKRSKESETKIRSATGALFRSLDAISFYSSRAIHTDTLDGLQRNSAMPSSLTTISPG